MIKFFFTLVIAAVLGISGYCIYLGVTESENNNAGMIAIDAGNLAESVTNTFKDGASVLAAKAKTVKDSAVETVKETTAEVVDKTVDTVKNIKSAN